MSETVQSAEKLNTTYSANDMDEVDDKIHYRTRPALVWGGESGTPDDPYSSMQRTAFREITENSVDEALQGFATNIEVHIFSDYSFEVFDNGRGIPVDINKKTGKSGIYQAIGTLRSGRNFKSHDNKKATGTNGLGASAVAVFSDRYDVTVYRNGKKYSLSFEHGNAGFFDEPDNPKAHFTPVEKVSDMLVEKDDRPLEERKKWPTGTRTKVWLDTTAFPTPYHYNDQDIIERLKSTAFLTPGLKIHIVNELRTTKDEVTGEEFLQEETFDFPNGLTEMVEHIQPDEKLTNVVIFEGEGRYMEKNVQVLQSDGKVQSENVERVVPYTVAFSYGNGYESTVRTFVNTVSTEQDGSHLTAVENAMRSAFNARFQSVRGLMTKKDELPIAQDFKEGLTMVVSIFAVEPKFTGQSKGQLLDKSVEKAVREAVLPQFESWIKNPKNADDFAIISKKVVTAAQNRQKAREQRDLNRKKNEISAAKLPINLIDCQAAGTESAELYLCEGFSARDSLKAARNSEINALIALKGKPINALKSKMSDVLKNEEVQDIAAAMGAGIGDDFDIDKMRYGRIFLAVDADPDGNNIATLLYAMFWKLFKPVILSGKLYKIETPLFVITVGDKKFYAHDEERRDKIVAKLQKSGKKNISISRLKGLGEVNEDVLEETAINPATRTITQITVGDIAKAQASLDLVLSNLVEPRKQWIEESASTMDEEILVGE